MKEYKQGELIVHLGPPKTATTSFQFFFQNLLSDEIIYFGVFQPRPRVDNSMARKIYSCVALNDTSEWLSVKTYIRKCLDEGKSVLISEEMFLVETNELKYSTKLQRLRNLLIEFEPKILVVARDPRDVLPSYYSEMYFSINNNDIANFEQFVESDYSNVYRYQTLLNELKAVGFSSIKIVQYDKLISNQYRLSDLFSYISLDQVISLPLLNNSMVGDRGEYRKRVSIARVLLHKAPIFKRLRKFRFLRIASSFIFQFKILSKPIDSKISDERLTSFSNEYQRIKEPLS